MAYTDWKQLASGTQVHTWGSAGKMKFDAKYRYERVGADVKYNIYLYFYKNSSSYFNDDINLTVDLDGTEVAYIHPFKDDSSWPATMDREFTVSNKTTGTTTCTFNLWDAQGTKEFDKYFTYSLEVPPAGSDLNSASCNSSGVATLTATKYSGDFRDDWFINDINDQIRLDTWSYSGAAGNYTQTRTLSKDTLALLASKQNTATPSLKAYLQSYQGTTGLGQKTKTFTATVGKSTGGLASASIVLDQNGNEYLQFYTNISSFASNNIANRLTLYATNSSGSSSYRYQIYQGYVTNDVRYTVTNSDYIQTLFDYAGNNNSVYLYAVIDSYAVNSTYTTYLGQSTVNLISVSLSSKTIVGSSSITELNTGLNQYKSSGNENKIFISRLSSVRYNMSANISNYNSKTKIYGQDIGFYANNSAVSNPYTLYNLTSLPTIKASIARSIVQQADITPSGTTLLSYNYPTLSQNTIRCDSSGNAMQTGDCIKLNVYPVYTDLRNTSGINTANLQTATITYTIADNGNTTTGTITTPTSGAWSSVILSGFDYKKSASVTINFVDQLGQTINTITDTVQPGRPGMYGWKTSDGNNHTTVNDYLNVEGDTTLTNVLSFTQTGDTNGVWKGLYGYIASNDQWIIRGSQTGNNAGYLEIATGDDGNEPIYIRQYGVSGATTPSSAAPGTNCRTLTLLDSNGDTNIPGALKLNGTNILDKIYPSGSIYITTNASFNPNGVFPGTWTQITGDAYLKIVTSNANNYGGQSNHKIGTTHLPSHNHSVSIATSGDHYHDSVGRTSSGSSGGSIFESYSGAGGTRGVRLPRSGENGAHTHTVNQSNVGDGNAYYPYYYGVYVWRRQ
ncbi:MAG: hypothetical protein J6Y28_08130 [Acholeplasmatales bacterium]|nr:hypothetical protein [Acholeplasmatales bacterium]